MTPLQQLGLVGIAGVGVAMSYGFALLGEPQAMWLWCQMLGAC